MGLCPTTTRSKRQHSRRLVGGTSRGRSRSGPALLVAALVATMLPSNACRAVMPAAASSAGMRRSVTAAYAAVGASSRQRGAAGLPSCSLPPSPSAAIAAGQRSPYSTSFPSTSTPLVRPLSAASAFVNSASLSPTRPRRFPSSSSSLSSTPSSSDGSGGGGGFFADPTSHPTFESIGVSSPVLLERVQRMLHSLPAVGGDDDAAAAARPSAVQAASYTPIASGSDVTIGSETGSGKTLAYLLPLIDDVLKRKREIADSDDDEGGASGYLGYDYARAVVLVPNKELAAQVTRMAAELCGGRERCLVWEGGSAPDPPLDSSDGVDGDGQPNQNRVDERDIVRLAVMPGGLLAPQDFRPFRLSTTEPLHNPPVDILITTPANLGPWALSPKNIDLFADIRTLVVDEADMLLDGGYIRQLENVLMGFRRADRLDASHGVERTQHVLVAATLPDVGLKSVHAYISKKFPYAERVAMDGMHNARHYGLQERTNWISDEEGGGNRERMEMLVRMLQTPRAATAAEGGGGEEEVVDGLKGEKVMVFLNSVDDVDGATGAFRRAGLGAVPYHAKIPLSERADNLDRFRRFDAESSDGSSDEDDGDGAVPVLVCTDLASRGLDVPGVTAIVQLQFAGNVVAHLHRMGRCGRAGKRDGRGVVFYGKRERELVEVVREAERQQETMALEQDVMDEEANEEGGRKKKVRGTVQEAFSRKRGFTKKRKKVRREAREASANSD